MSEALEITTLRLVSGLTGADFVNANNDINEYLRRQPGPLVDTVAAAVPPSCVIASARGLPYRSRAVAWNANHQAGFDSVITPRSTTASRRPS
jgi:hypothetical protein